MSSENPLTGDSPVTIMVSFSAATVLVWDGLLNLAHEVCATCIERALLNLTYLNEQIEYIWRYVCPVVPTAKRVLTARGFAGGEVVG